MVHPTSIAHFTPCPICVIGRTSLQVRFKAYSICYAACTKNILLIIARVFLMQKAKPSATIFILNTKPIAPPCPTICVPPCARLNAFPPAPRPAAVRCSSSAGSCARWTRPRCRPPRTCPATAGPGTRPWCRAPGRWTPTPTGPGWWLACPRPPGRTGAGSTAHAGTGPCPPRWG